MKKLRKVLLIIALCAVSVTAIMPKQLNEEKGVITMDFKDTDPELELPEFPVGH